VNAKVRCRPWNNSNPPKKILAIRFQALGDTLITLPYLQELKSQLPQTTFHFLTREEVSAIPKEVSFFDKVITIKGQRNAKLQLALILAKIPFLIFQSYDFVLDLQNNRVSKVVRKLLFTRGWSEFDKWSPLSAAERTRQTINAGGFCNLNPSPKFFLEKKLTENFFLQNNIHLDYDIVVLNPAGYCASRNWPLHNYALFAKLWLQHINEKTCFVLLLMPNLQEKANYIKDELGHHCVDLTGKANQIQALQIIQRCRLMLTEDSGLMHMAWIQHIPTVALFSSSRKDWSAPQGELSVCFDSSDMECGPCMKEICIFNDNRCLTRYTPEIVFLQAKELLSKRNSENV
jgi:heptosyltransferase II